MERVNLGWLQGFLGLYFVEERDDLNGGRKHIQLDGENGS